MVDGLASPEGAFQLEKARLEAGKMVANGQCELPAGNIVGNKHDEKYFQGMSLVEVEYICRQVHHLSDSDDRAKERSSDRVTE